MEVFLFIIICLLFIALFYCIKQNKQYKEKLNKHQIKNAQIEEDNQKLFKENEQLFTKKTILENEAEELAARRDELTNSINNLTKAQDTILETTKARNEEAIMNQMIQLEQRFQGKKEELDESLELMKDSYFKVQSKLNKELNGVQQELDKIKATRAAAIQAQVREKEIEQQSSFYCLQITDSDIADIQKLNNIKKTLNKPRVLSMLIWQTWFQKPLKSLAANILGTSTITGIYKITNIVTKECYIGQAVDVATRWNEHAKCGLGIDTPAGNKLYAAMQEYGLESFSWELLEQCSREELNEKERYYIDLYDTVNYGYNSTKGNK